MVKQNVKNENTKISITIKSLICCVVSIVPSLAAGGYMVGYYKASLDSELRIIKLNQEHQQEIATLKETESRLRIELASYKNKTLEDLISVIKYINKDEKNN